MTDSDPYEQPGPPTAGPLGSRSATRIVPVLSHAGNQRVLLDWLREHDHYETVSDGTTAISDVDFDAILVDEHALRQHDTEIRERKADTEAFLPVLLVSSTTAVSTLDTRVQTETEQTGLPLVDEVITTPVDTAELETRLDTLARIRAQSIALERKTAQLLLLNRVTRHDIRNDMNVVMAWAEQLEDHIDGGGERMRRRILDSSRHVVDITTAVREFVETLQTNDDPDLQTTDLRDVLTDELAKRRATFDNAEFVVDGEIPRVDVRANELLASVFRNVLNNAVQHNDGETPRVEITVAESGEIVTVTVCDDGPGIPPDQRDAVVGRTDRGLDHSAAGLGLYLVDTLVDQYGGTLQIGDADLGGVAIAIELTKGHPADSTPSDHAPW